MNPNDKILDKIRNLLELAEDGNQDEESQTALLMAQKLMLKHKISQQELDAATSLDAIVTRSLSVYKTLFWWEKILARTIADNFLIMLYVQSTRLPHQSKTQRKIVYMGYQSDVDLAYHVFQLAANAMKFHAGQHLKLDHDGLTSSQKQNQRRAYYQGFMDGLAAKYEQQRQSMVAEEAGYALVIQVPEAVKEAFHAQVQGQIVFKQPVVNEQTLAYERGYHQAKSMSLDAKQLDSGLK